MSRGVRSQKASIHLRNSELNKVNSFLYYRTYQRLQNANFSSVLEPALTIQGHEFGNLELAGVIVFIP